MVEDIAQEPTEQTPLDIVPPQQPMPAVKQSQVSEPAVAASSSSAPAPAQEQVNDDDDEDEFAGMDMFQILRIVQKRKRMAEGHMDVTHHPEPSRAPSPPPAPLPPTSVSASELPEEMVEEYNATQERLERLMSRCKSTVAPIGYSENRPAVQWAIDNMAHKSMLTRSRSVRHDDDNDDDYDSQLVVLDKCLHRVACSQAKPRLWRKPNNVRTLRAWCAQSDIARCPRPSHHQQMRFRKVWERSVMGRMTKIQQVAEVVADATDGQIKMVTSMDLDWDLVEEFHADLDAAAEQAARKAAEADSDSD